MASVSRKEEELEDNNNLTLLVSSFRNTSLSARNVPSRRRHVAKQAILDRYHAKPLLLNNGSSCAGISIAGWDIGTGQGPIGDQHWFQEACDKLEPMSQPVAPLNDDNHNDSKRQLVLPEMVFPLAHVVLDRRQPNGDLFLSWDAMEALQEWSKAHRNIPLPTGKTEELLTEPSSSVPYNNHHRNHYRGVNILQSSDASLWERKLRESDGTSSSEMPPVGSTTFHFDWTYSTPYFGSFYGSLKTDNTAPSTTTSSSNSKSSKFTWIPLEESSMPMHLLTDQSVPILYFDDLVLYEDDLHDNGQVEYTVKVRVMPTCAYVLSRLFLRVDNVLLRVRDCRVLVEFDTSTAAAAAASHLRKRVYRSVTWRECPWDRLASHRLPTDVRAWTTTIQPTIGGAGAETMTIRQETPAFHHMLSKLPIQTLPNDIPQHSELRYE